MENGDSQISDSILEQVTLFEDKITSCERSYGPSELEFWLGYFKSTPVVRHHGEIRCLRQLFQLLDDAQLLGSSKGGQVYDRPPDKLFRYFEWFQKFLGYLQELNDTFVQQVLQPLKLFFPEDSASESAFSRLSKPGYVTSGGISSASKTRDTFEELLRENTHDHLEEMQDLRELYDDKAFCDVTKDLQRTVLYWEIYLKEDTEFDMDFLEEITMSPEKGTNNIGKDVLYLLRLIPTLLIQCQKAGALAREWVNLYSLKTVSIESRLEKVKKIQRSLTKKLTSVGEDILEKEKELEKQSDDLQHLLHREERSNEINARLYENEQSLKSLDNTLMKATTEKDILIGNIQKASAKGESNLTALHLQYEENRLQRYLLQRKIKARQYCRSLLQNDLDLEMEIQPVIVRYTNDAQEKCEALERSIQRRKEDELQIRSILTPLERDKHRMQEDMLIRSLGSLQGSSSLDEDLSLVNGMVQENKLNLLPFETELKSQTKMVPGEIKPRTRPMLHSKAPRRLPSPPPDTRPQRRVVNFIQQPEEGRRVVRASNPVGGSSRSKGFRLDEQRYEDRNVLNRNNSFYKY